MLALENVAIIDKKLIKDLVLSKVVEVVKPTSIFICFLLRLVSKYDRGWKKIHYLLYPPGQFIHDHILDGVEKLYYTCFYKVFKIVIQAGKNCVIFKQNIKYTFKNVSMTSHHQWLLSFI